MFSLNSLTSVKTFIRRLSPHQYMMHALKHIDCSSYHLSLTNYFKSSHHHELKDFNYCSLYYSAPQLIHIHNIWHDVLSDGFLPPDALFPVSVDHQICQPLNSAWVVSSFFVYLKRIKPSNSFRKLPCISLLIKKYVEKVSSIA